MSGRIHGSKNGQPVTVVCVQCGKMREVVFSRRAAKFCNQECRRAAAPSAEEKRRRIAENAARWRNKNTDRLKKAWAGYRAKNGDKINARTKQWRVENPEKYLTGKRRCRLQKTFGLSFEQYDAMLAAQGGVCAICKQPETHQRKGVWNLSVDHCHATGRVRGLLCNRCNRGIGLLADDAELCRKAAEYLSR